LTTLRVLLSEAPAAARSDGWALYDAQGALLREGRDPPERWPAAQRSEAVLAALATRVVGLHLPPMPPERIAAAARFAIEDQLAGPLAEHALAIATQRGDGVVPVVVAEAALVAALAHRFSRVIAEPALAPVPGPTLWRWYNGGGGGGFVRTPDGGAFPVGDADRGQLPAELALALDHAARADCAPHVVELAFSCADDRLAQWGAASGVPFRQVEAWRWQASSPAAFAAAPDLAPTDDTGRASRRVRRAQSSWRYAAIIAGAAIALHMAASVGQWVTLRMAERRATADLAALARSLDVPDADDAATMAARISRMHTAQRHRAGRDADDDALPLLARAAPGLAALPPGVLKSATYADAAWTFDLAQLDARPAGELEQRLAAAGLAVLKAPTPSGLRLRATLAAGRT
jgi:hypothetical protein